MKPSRPIILVHPMSRVATTTPRATYHCSSENPLGEKFPQLTLIFLFLFISKEHYITSRNEFLLYAVNRLHFATDSELWQTLDEMTSMKILSRIEGDNERCEHVLREMKNLLTETVGNHAEDSASLKKIDEMLAKLKSGYTSYWA